MTSSARHFAEGANMQNLNNNDLILLLTNLWSIFKDFLLGMLGGMIAYIYSYKKHTEAGNNVTFSIGNLIINMVLGSFVAYSIGTIIPLGVTGRDAIIGFSGVFAYNILNIAESKFAEWIVSKITKN